MARLWASFVAVCAMVAIAQLALAQTIYPSKDGTLADGGTYGTFDGVADNWDWTFNQTSYEGSITLATDPNSALEHRVVWEYNLAGVTFQPPVNATLTFTLRGAPIWPFPDVDTHVYSYPADLQETPDDFAAGPNVLQGVVTTTPYQEPTEFTLDVSAAVNEALTSGADKLGLRFQIDPNTANIRNQAFIDALDSDQTTKPYLTVTEGSAIPGDVDGDGDVDIADLGELLASYGACTGDPDFNAAADFDDTGCVDLADLGVLLGNYGAGT